MRTTLRAEQPVDCDESSLLEYAEGLLSSEDAAAVLAHLDGCSSCRAVLASLARDRTVTTSPAPPRQDPVADLVPAGLIRQHLAAEASKREATMARLMILVVIAAVPAEVLVAPIWGRAVATILSVQASLLVYALALRARLKRGWFHPALPLVNAVVESAVIGGVYLITVDILGVVAGHTFAAFPLWGAYIVFTAIRCDVRIPLLAGTAAAVELIAVDLIWGGGGAELGLRDSLAVTVTRAGFLLIAGAAGAVLARYLTSRTEAALRAIREQDLFGKYLLGERIGAGGMGEVFRATYCPEGGFVRPVAIKRLRADLSASPAFAQAFREEARLGATLVHPNLVQVLDCGVLRGQFVLAMEFVDGLSLRALLAATVAPLELAAVTYLATELAAALDYVHSRTGEDGRAIGLVHCDVNAPNVLVSRLGTVKLADFGVARAFDPAARAGSGVFGGKRAYAAPEQLRGGPLDARTDLFALGVTIHEALCGPLRAGGAIAPAAALAPPSSLRPDVPAALDRLVSSLLSPDPAGRPATAAAARRALLDLGGDLAPYPAGQVLLADAVDRAIRHRAASFTPG